MLVTVFFVESEIPIYNFDILYWNDFFDIFAQLMNQKILTWIDWNSLCLLLSDIFHKFDFLTFFI